MNYMLPFVLAFSLAPTVSFAQASTASSQAPAPSPQAAATQPHRLVHITIINMSGKSREAHVRDTIVPLPVAERIALQVYAGEPVKIMSNTNQHVLKVITISPTDEGLLFPVD